MAIDKNSTSLYDKIGETLGMWNVECVENMKRLGQV